MARAFLLSLLLSLGACSFAHVNEDDEARPETVIGAGATTMYPGQRGPGMGAVLASPPGARAPAPGPRGVPAPPSAGTQPGPRSTGIEPAPREELTVIGGASEDVSRSVRRRDTPLGPLTAILGYPFWIFGKSVEQKADEASQEQRSGNGTSSSSSSGSGVPRTQDDLERARLERENALLLDEMARHASRTTVEPEAAPMSIAQELAALRGRREPAPRPGGGLVAPVERAREAIDRNGDGRVDYWIYTGPGDQTREMLDENADGQPDLIRVLGPDGQLIRLEEDLDGDGLREVVSLYEGGDLVRRCADTNGDAQADTWSFYRDGEVIRHEVDRDGDGFRDLMLYYEAGELAQEEQDQNGDGRPDVTVWYRQGEIFAREEDLDYDGTPDVISHYENGKLVRKEVRSEDLLRTSPEGGS